MHHLRDGTWKKLVLQDAPECHIHLKLPCRSVFPCCAGIGNCRGHFFSAGLAELSPPTAWRAPTGCQKEWCLRSTASRRMPDECSDRANLFPTCARQFRDASQSYHVWPIRAPASTSHQARMRWHMDRGESNDCVCRSTLEKAS